MKFLFLFLLTTLPVIAQSKFDFKSPANIKQFADYLYCEMDFLRAAEEYNRLTGSFRNDTLIFKTGLCYFNIGNLNQSGKIFDEISDKSNFYDDALFQKYRIIFLNNPSGFYSFYQRDQYPGKEDNLFLSSYKLAMISSLLNENLKLSESEFTEPFNTEERKHLKFFFDWKNNPPFKSPVLSVIFSTIIPGSGKIYTEEYGDGIVAFLTTGLLTFLAYDNFRANHKTRAWIFTSLTGLFYAGNIYGSIASAQIYNARISFEFKDDINLFLEKNNYFSPEYDFCK